MPYKYEPTPQERFLLETLDNDPELAQAIMARSPEYKAAMDAAVFGRNLGAEVESLLNSTPTETPSSDSPSESSSKAAAD